MGSILHLLLVESVLGVPTRDRRKEARGLKEASVQPSFPGFLSPRTAARIKVKVKVKVNLKLKLKLSPTPTRIDAITTVKVLTLSAKRVKP
jgi:hypothetical protein